MTPDQRADDDRLFDELRAALASAGTVPAHVVAAAKGAFELRYLDDELARLTYDSRTDAELVGAFRSETLSVRSLVFSRGELTLDVDVLADSFVGQLAPAGPGVIVVETRERPVGRGDIDDAGMFSLPMTAPGEVRFRIELSGARPFVTEWTQV